MRKFGLIGYPLSHSFSPSYFNKKFKQEKINDARYDLYPLESIVDFQKLELESISGLNVTIPYKETVIPYLNEMSKEAREIGAVNVIVFQNEKLIGHNSDVYGFQRSIEPFWQDREQPKGALVLGTGGASKAVCYVLKELGIKYLQVSRTKGDMRYSEVTKSALDNHRLIVNTTPLGMSPNLDSCPNIPYEFISSEHFLLDLVYNPLKTLFLEKGEASGAVIQNGLEMLRFQADKAWELWNTDS